MKYLVLENDVSIKFVIFGGPGDQLTVSSEMNAMPYYVRQFKNNQTGTFSVNETNNYCGGTIFTLINAGCNIFVDGQVVPQGISVMKEGQKFTVAKLTMCLIDEDERSGIEGGKQIFYSTICCNCIGINELMFSTTKTYVCFNLSLQNTKSKINPMMMVKMIGMHRHRHQ